MDIDARIISDQQKALSNSDEAAASLISEWWATEDQLSDLFLNGQYSKGIEIANSAITRIENYCQANPNAKPYIASTLMECYEYYLSHYTQNLIGISDNLSDREYIHYTKNAINIIDKAIALEPYLLNDAGIQDTWLLEKMDKLRKTKQHGLSEIRDAQLPPSNSSRDKRCFIATAVYSPGEMAKVDLLRDFRDQTLLQHKVGKVCIKCYYTLSPSIARVISRSTILRRIGQVVLDPIVDFVARHKYLHS